MVGSGGGNEEGHQQAIRAGSQVLVTQGIGELVRTILFLASTVQLNIAMDRFATMVGSGGGNEEVNQQAVGAGSRVLVRKGY